MPNIPKTSTLTAKAADILNAIRNNASVNYRDYVPSAVSDENSIRAIGNIIMDYQSLQNEFISALVNRIGLVLITSKAYQNPWAQLKKGMLQFGETVEEVFTNIANVQSFDPVKAESEVFKRVIPDVRAAFHMLNYQKFYKVSVSREQLQQAFLSMDGLNRLVEYIIQSLYTGMEYDEFLAMKYLIARNILNGRLHAESIPDVSAESMKSIASAIKGVSDNFAFMSTAYNPSGVLTRSDKEDQYLFITAEANALMDVEVLAAAFNMDKAEFAGHRILVDSFGVMDTARLEMLFADDPKYKELTADELAALSTVPAVLVNRDFMMVFDNLLEMREIENPQGLYWQYFLHTWKTFSTSPFSNACVFVPGTPTVESVELSPKTVSVPAGSTNPVPFNVTVTTSNFASKTVNWQISGGNSTISPQGVVTIDPELSAGSEVTIIASSTLSPAKADSATITLT